GKAEVALARAQLAVEVHQWQGAGDPAAALDTAAARTGDRADPGLAFDLALLRLFSDYWAELVPGDGRPPFFGPEGRDPAVLDELDRRAGHLAATASDARRRARAAFYAGIIADNLRAEPERAEDLFTQALAACRPGADDDYAAEALRHLGGCAQAAGDLTLARERWERSAPLRWPARPPGCRWSWLSRPCWPTCPPTRVPWPARGPWPPKSTAGPPPCTSPGWPPRPKPSCPADQHHAGGGY